MANKYIIHGATYCGNGTASNEATSSGAAGAWNDINVFENTAPAYGALVAGDVVYIRSKSSAGADITRTLAASVGLGSTNASSAAPITWILDNGAIWSGVDGVLTYSMSKDYIVSFRVDNIIRAETVGNLVVKHTATNPSQNPFSYVLGAARGITFDTLAKTGINSLMIAVNGILEDPVFDTGRLGATTNSYGLISQSAAATGLLINPDINLDYATPAGQQVFGFQGAFVSNLTVIGGRIRGNGITSAQTVARLHTTPGSQLSLIGTDVPKELIPCADVTFYGQQFTMIGCENGIGGHLEALWGYATSRSDNNPPTLGARFPDSGASPWSYRVYPRNPTTQNPVTLPIVKLYTETAAAKEVTVEVLVANTMSPNKANVWANIQYTDSTTGAPKNICTRDFAAGSLATSSAAWTGRSGSEVPWGMVTLNPYKLTVTTPTAIKQDTPVTVTFFTTLNARGNTANILFVDPDFALAST